MTTESPENPARIGDHAGAPSHEALCSRFIALWRRCAAAASEPDARTAWNGLERRYGESHRHYHDKRHLAHCLGQFDLVLDRIRNPDQVELAIWFHDIVNEPGRRDNEALSAELFHDLADAIMPAPFVTAVVGLILATTHRRVPSDSDQRILCDIDLASLGCPWECYLHDTGNLRAEFRGSDQDYCRSKRAFLQSMLSRPRIYTTDFFYSRYEQAARDNLHRLLALLDEWEADSSEDGIRVPRLRTSGLCL